MNTPPVGSGRLLIYGANGFVGEAASRLARERGIDTVLAGRDPEKIGALADALELEGRAFELTDRDGVRDGLAGIDVVLNMAGPFTATYEALAVGCLDAGAHYVDITGELQVHEGLLRLHAPASERGVMLLPSAGLDAVPADCLAAHLLRRLPGTTAIQLGLGTTGPAGLPPGTQRTMIQVAHLPDRVVRDGRLVAVEGVPTIEIDLGEGSVPAVRYPAPDPFVVHRTTGVPNVESYVALPVLQRLGYRLVRSLRPLFAPQVVRDMLGRLVRPGPSVEARSKSHAHVWARATDPDGTQAVSRLHGPEGAVEWTIRTALGVAEKALAGEAVPGVQTVAGAFGPDFVMEVEGVTREDVK